MGSLTNLLNRCAVGTLAAGTLAFGAGVYDIHAAEYKPKGSVQHLNTASQARAKSPNALGLEEVIKKKIGTIKDSGKLLAHEEVSVVVHDVYQNMRLVSINPSSIMDAASTAKAVVALVNFHLVSKGDLIYDDEIRNDLELALQKIGKAYRESNKAITRVMEKIGGPARIQRILDEEYGHIFSNTSIVEMIPEDGKTYGNKITAEDYARFWLALWRKELPFSDELSRLLEWSKPDQYHQKPLRIFDMWHKISSYAKLVVNKSGTTNRVISDGGVVVININGLEYPYVVVGIIQSAYHKDTFKEWSERAVTTLRQLNMTVPHFIMQNYKSN